MGAKQSMSLSEGKKSRKGRIFSLLLTILVVAGLVAAYFLLEREKPQISLNEPPAVIGAQYEFAFTASDKRSGIRSIDVRLLQDGKEVPLFNKDFERIDPLNTSNTKSFSGSAAVAAKDQGLKDGTAEIIIAVRDFSWWNWMAGNRTEQRYPITLDTTPPKIALLDSGRYITAGGSGVVTYTINEPVQSSGVQLNDTFHPGYPLTGQDDGRYVAYVGLPYDSESISRSLIRAVDTAGNQGELAFGMIFRAGKFKQDSINVGDGFLDWKIPEFRQYYSAMSGTPVEQYIYVNNTVRRENNDQIVQICSTSSPERYWRDRFLRMAGSTRAGFADHRTYNYHGEEIDRQVHLGMDIASTSQVDIKAANRGIVAYADYLGIYGNTVILDHGQGLFSLYAHLSQIAVKKGDLIPQNGVIGHSGTTGMAGGDHLHFSILINGVFVNPLEWWDSHWIANNITSVLPRG